MKQHTSVLALWARRTLPLTLLVTAVTAAVQIGTFYFAMGRSAAVAPVAFLSMEELLEQTRMEIQFLTGLFLVGLAAICPLRPGAKWRYTLRRLRIAEEAAILWYAAAVFGCFLIYWGAETAVCLGLVRMAATASGPDYVSGQTGFLLSQGLPLFQGLLPVTSAVAYVRNVMIFLTLALFAAMGCRGPVWMSAYMVELILYMRLFVRDLDWMAWDIAVITAAALCLMVAAATLVGTWRGGGNERADL